VKSGEARAKKERTEGYLKISRSFSPFCVML